MKRTKCEECAGRIVRRNVEFELYGVSLGKFPADVCLKCGEEVFDEQASDRIDEIAKKKRTLGPFSDYKSWQVRQCPGHQIEQENCRFPWHP